MAETKIQEWKRRIAHKRRKEQLKKEAKELADAMKTWNTVKNGVKPGRTFGQNINGKWTVDFETDMFTAQYGLDVEKEITKQLAEQMRIEIDNEIRKSLGLPPELLGKKRD